MGLRVPSGAVAVRVLPPPTLYLTDTELLALLSNSEVMNASIYTARGRVNGYPDRHATGTRRVLAERHGIAPEQIVLGNGAAELLQAAAMALLGEGDELLTPWPSYPLYPLMAARAGAKPVAVGSTNFRVDIPLYADLYMQGRLLLDELVSDTIKLDDVNDAYSALVNGDLARAVISFD